MCVVCVDEGETGEVRLVRKLASNFPTKLGAWILKGLVCHFFFIFTSIIYTNTAVVN